MYFICFASCWRISCCRISKTKCTNDKNLTTQSQTAVVSKSVCCCCCCCSLIHFDKFKDSVVFGLETGESDTLPQPRVSRTQCELTFGRHPLCDIHGLFIVTYFTFYYYWDKRPGTVGILLTLYLLWYAMAFFLELCFPKCGALTFLFVPFQPTESYDMSFFLFGKQTHRLQSINQL